MPLPSPSRLAAVLVLAVVLAGLPVWYGSLPPDPGVGDYPGNEDLAADYDRHLGAAVVVHGRIVGTDPVVIAAPYGVDGRLELTVVGPAVPDRVGDSLHAFGVAEPDGTIRAARAYATSTAGHWYAYSVSFLAGLWVLGRIVRGWRYEPAAGGLAPRDSPLGLRAIVRARRAPLDGEDPDA